MALSEDGLRAYQAAMAALIGKIGDLPQPILGGRAAALGTLTSMLKRIDVLLIALSNRPATEVDRNDILRDASTLDWLSDTKWIADDFKGIAFALSDEAQNLAFAMAIDSLKQGLNGTAASA
jgi:hypothetical protein